MHELPVAFGIVICFDAPQRLRFPRLTFATKKLSTGTSLSGQRRMQLILLSARAVTSPFKLSGPGPMAERVSVNSPEAGDSEGARALRTSPCPNGKPA